MAFIIADRIKETSISTGTGTFTLAGAVTGFQSFSAIGNTNTTGYCIFAVDSNGVPTGEWETGIGTYTSSGTTLSRGFIASSTGSAVSFAAGTKHVICCDIANYLTPLVMATTANRAIQVAAQTALSSTSGNARGNGAVDLQVRRTAAAKVASGAYSTVSGGQNNLASGPSSTASGGTTNSASSHYATVGGGNTNTASANAATVAGGKSNSASGAQSFIGGGRYNTCSGDYSTIAGGENHSINVARSVIGGGQNNTITQIKSTIAGGSFNTISSSWGFIGGGLTNTVSGTYAVVAGGYQNTASGMVSTAMGNWALADKRGQVTYASGKFSTLGDAQTSHFMLRATTSNNTQTEMFTGSGSGQLTLSNDTTWAFQVLLVARRTDSDGTNSSWSASGCVKRDTNAASTALVGTCTATVIQQDAGAAATAVDISVDTTTGALRIRVTGETSKTYKWHALVTTSEVTG